MKRPIGLGLIIISTFAFGVFAQAGTRELPPPPPRTSDQEERFQESYFGREDLTRNRGRFRALEDDEGREVDVHSAGRAPASVRPRPDMPTEQRRVDRELEHEEREMAADADGASRVNVERRVWKTPTRPSMPIHKTEVSRAPASMTDTFGAGVSSPNWMREQSKSVDQSVTRQDTLTARKGVQEISVIANDLGFFPKTVFVSRDIPVRLFVTGASKQPLCIMMDSFNVKKQVRSQKVEEITFTPSSPGTYRFYCPVNGSEGVLVVRELGGVDDAS